MGEQWDQFLTFIESRSRMEGTQRERRAEWAETIGVDPLLGSCKFGSPWRRVDNGSRTEDWKLQGMRQRYYANEKWKPVSYKLEQLIFILLYRHSLVSETATMLMDGWTPQRIADYACKHGTRVMHDCIKIWPRLWVKPATSGADVEWTTENLDPVTSLEQLDSLGWAVYCHLHYIDILDNLPWLEWLTNAPIGGHDATVIHQEFCMRFPRLGEFKAYEVMTSLTYTDWWELDEWSFVHVGHGAEPAIRMLEPDLDPSCYRAWLVRATEAVQTMLDRRGILVYPRLTDISGNEVTYRHFTPRTLEDCLCEWRKFVQVKAGTRDARPFDAGDNRWRNKSV